ncbi:septal ring lytic transglycosylase RlpA family protein [Flectobacillus major]|jgi:rare lipoprotein A|uniref:septal ring lytic transglycosylase RlpA family protein n=1 Tax=Flectobacillus major TaxID=103 RepID=UPI0004126DB1|nr:septal ring lytic transglycosylase RlpA family protein [Flectobacillus major]
MKKRHLGILTISLLVVNLKPSNAQKLGDESYGIASFYANNFYNQPTSTGEILKKNQYTAAHMTLPFGTMLEVTNLANKRFVIIRINDRGPYKPGRIIDLTENPAKWLKMSKEGLTKVRLKVVGFDGDIMLESYDSLSIVASPKLETKYYQKPIIQHNKYYRLRKNWHKRKYPHLKYRRLKVNSYLRKLSRQRKNAQIQAQKKK